MRNHQHADSDAAQLASEQFVERGSSMVPLYDQ